MSKVAELVLRVDVLFGVSQGTRAGSFKWSMCE